MNSRIYQSKPRGGIITKTIEAMKISSVIEHDGLDGKDDFPISFSGTDAQHTTLNQTDDDDGVPENFPKLVVKIDLSKLTFRRNDVKTSQSTEDNSRTVLEVEDNVYFTSHKAVKRSTSELDNRHNQEMPRKDKAPIFTGPQVQSIILKRFDEHCSGSDYFDTTKQNRVTQAETQAFSRDIQKHGLGDMSARLWQRAGCNFNEIDGIQRKPIPKLSLSKTEQAQLYFCDGAAGTRHNSPTEMSRNVCHLQNSNKPKDDLIYFCEPTLNTSDVTPITADVVNKQLDEKVPQIYFSGVPIDPMISNEINDNNQTAHAIGIQESIGCQQRSTFTISDSIRRQLHIIENDNRPEQKYLNEVKTNRDEIENPGAHENYADNQPYFQKSEFTLIGGDTYSGCLPTSLRLGSPPAADEIEALFSQSSDSRGLAYYQPPWMVCANTPEVSHQRADVTPEQPVEIGSLVIEHLRPPVTGRVLLRPKIMVNDKTA